MRWQEGYGPLTGDAKELKRRAETKWAEDAVPKEEPSEVGDKTAHAAMMHAHQDAHMHRG